MTELIPLNEGETFSEAEIAFFEQNYLPIVQDYAACVKQKKQFEDKEKKFKKQLGEIMDKLGIKTMDCPFVRFTRVAAGTDSVVVDVAALEENEPDLYAELLADYPKTVKGKASYVLFTVK